jgi:hypothetical protein
MIERMARKMRRKIVSFRERKRLKSIVENPFPFSLFATSIFFIRVLFQKKHGGWFKST